MDFEKIGLQHDFQHFLMVSQQETQLPLRNRTSAMYFFVANLLSVAVMTYSYVCHLRSLSPMIQVIYYAHANKLQHATVARAHDARPHCRWCLFSRESLHTNFTLRKTRVPKLQDSCYSMGLTVSFYAIVFDSQEKMFKTSVNARRHSP